MMADMDLYLGALYELKRHFSRDQFYYLDEFEGLSVAHNFCRWSE